MAVRGREPRIPGRMGCMRRNAGERSRQYWRRPGRTRVPIRLVTVGGSVGVPVRHVVDAHGEVGGASRLEQAASVRSNLALAVAAAAAAERQRWLKPPAAVAAAATAAGTQYPRHDTDYHAMTETTKAYARGSTGRRGAQVTAAARSSGKLEPEKRLPAASVVGAPLLALAGPPPLAPVEKGK